MVPAGPCQYNSKLWYGRKRRSPYANDKLNHVIDRVLLADPAAALRGAPTAARGGPSAMMNRKMAAILQERQAQLAQHSPTARMEHHSPRRPVTAGQAARPKVTCAMLNETERMLLRAPNRHKSMLSAGPSAPTAASLPPPSEPQSVKRRPDDLPRLTSCCARVAEQD